MVYNTRYKYFITEVGSMKLKFRRLVSLAAAFLLAACTVMPGSVMAESKSEHARTGEGSADASQAAAESTINEIAEQFADPDNVLFDYTTEAGKRKALKLAEAENYPEQFDLSGKFLEDGDETSYITPVKFQNPWGNCWIFAAVAAAESSILGDEELRGDFVADIRKTDDPSKVQMDLSEKQLTYFAMTALNDPGNPQNGEGNVPINPEDDPVKEAYDIGGFAPTASEVMASGVGPVLESENPLFKYHGKKGTIQKQWIGDRYDKYCYSEDDDWAIDESLRFSSSFTLGESYKVPSPATIIHEDMDDIYDFNPAGITAMKAELLKKRAIEIGYHDDTFNPATAECGNYISGNWAQYTFETEGAGHAVTVVGWDDNYPRENFRHKSLDPEYYTEEDTMPPADMFPDGQHPGRTDGGNGAWLVKNSWGSGEEEFPDKGEGVWGIKDKETGKSTGYFWLSYYDKSIDTPESLDFQTNEKGTADYTDVIDQHDYSPIKDYMAAHVSNEVRMANIFTAGVCEDLKEVSCDTAYPDTEVTYDVYLLAGNRYESPTDGLHVASVTQKYQYAGFHKAKLPEKVRVMRGQQYSIVVTQKVPDEKSGTSYAVSLKLSTGNTIVNEGESLLGTGDVWTDLSDKDLQESLTELVLDDSKGATNFDNFAIKGYAEEMPDVVLVGDYSGDLTPLPDEDGSQAVAFFIAWITDNTGSDAYDGVVPEWKIAEGGEDILDMKDGRDPTRKTVMCKKFGWTYLTVSAEGIGTHVFSIKPGLFIQDMTDITAGKNYISAKLANTDQPGIGGYEVYYRKKGAKSWKVMEVAAPKDSVKITGLKAGQKYEIYARMFVDSPYGRYYSFDTMTKTVEVGLKNTLKAKGKAASVSFNKLKKKDQTVKRAKAIKVTGAKGKVTYAKTSGSKKITINKKTGNVTVKKGLKKGTYKIKVNVKAAGGGNYASATKKVTVKITVK